MNKAMQNRPPFCIQKSLNKFLARIKELSEPPAPPKVDQGFIHKKARNLSQTLFDLVKPECMTKVDYTFSGANERTAENSPNVLYEHSKDKKIVANSGDEEEYPLYIELCPIEAEGTEKIRDRVNSCDLKCEKKKKLLNKSDIL